MPHVQGVPDATCTGCTWCHMYRVYLVLQLVQHGLRVLPLATLPPIRVRASIRVVSSIGFRLGLGLGLDIWF